MRNFYNLVYNLRSALFLLGFLLICKNQQVQAQVTVTMTYSRTSTTCSCSDFGGADPYWEAESIIASGTSNGNGQSSGGNPSSISVSDVGFWCPGGTVYGRVRSCEDDDGGACGGLFDDCVTGWVNQSTATVNGPSNVFSGTTSGTWATSGSCRAGGNWSYTSGGSWPGTNIINTTGTTNPSCATAFNLGTNTSGTVVATHSADCSGDQWYKYTLTTANLSSIEFDLQAISTFNGMSEEEVRFGSCGGCNLSDDGGTGVWRIDNPRVGDYYIRGRISTTISGRAYSYRVIVNRGSVIARPTNDNFCNATNLSGAFAYNTATITNNVNTDNASSEDFCNANEPTYNNEKTVWWKFTVDPTNPPAKIVVNPSSSGGCTGQARIYTGTPAGTCSGGVFSAYNSTTFNGLSEINYTDFGNDMTIDCPTAGATYYIMGKVGGFCSSGSLTISLASNGAPRFANDLCAVAIPLSTPAAQGTTIGDATGVNKWNNFCATGGESLPGGLWTLDGNVRQSVWFKFNTGNSGWGKDVTINGYSDPASLGDKIDLKLALYKGPCASLTYVDRDYDPTLTLCLDGLCDETMEGKYCLLPNTDYYVLVDGSGLNTEGFFGLTVKDNGPYPANDLICGATTVANQTIYTYNSTTLSAESNVRGSNCFEPNPDWTFETGQDNDHAIWYYLGQVPGRTVVVDANSNGANDIDLQMALYSSTTPKGACVTPTSSPTLTEVQKEYAGAGVVWDEDAYFNCLDPAKYYWLMIDGSAGATSLITSLEEGIFSLRIWNPEEGEISGCAAENLGTIPDAGSITIKNLSNICGASSIANFPAPSTWGFDKAVVYKFTTPPSVGFTDASIKIEAFTNPYYDDETYTGADGGAGGNMGLLSGDQIDLQLAVYSAGDCTAPHTVVGSNYDPTVGSGADITGLTGSDEALLVNCLLPNTQYYLVVDGGSNTSGYFDIKMSNYNIHTTNDFLFNAIDVTLTNIAPWTDCNNSTIVSLNNQNNYCATFNNDWTLPAPFRPSTWAELNGPVWYKFKAPKSGKLQIRAYNSVSDLLPPYDEPEIDLQMAVFFLPGGYEGALDATTIVANKNRLQLIAHDFDGLLHNEDLDVECLMADSIYYLAIDGSSYTLCPGCTRGEFRLEFESNPRDRSAQNDLICDAIDLGTPAVWTNPAAYDTKVAPDAGAGTYGSPSSGYPNSSPTPGSLHGSPRTGTGTCMRAENNFCAGTAGEPALTAGSLVSGFSPDATVWYKFTAPSTGEVRIDVFSDPNGLGDLIYSQIAVFETSDTTCTGTMVNVAAEGIPNILNGNNNLTVKCLDPGKVYFLMVDGAGINTTGYFEVQVQAVLPTLSAPPNDDICAADVPTIAYPGSIGATTTLGGQNNRCANVQGVYPSPTTFTKDADVWYKFTTPSTAGPHAVEVNVTSGLPWPFGDAMDPQIALYKMNPTTGPCGSTSFNLVDDQYSAAGLPFTETMEFHCLEANTTYYLMVDGSGLNEQGNFNVTVKRINPHPLATNDNICSVGTTTSKWIFGCC
jgi:hypothetical protein